MLSFLIYLIGCFIAYASLTRSKTYCEPHLKLTNYDRKMALFYSIFSWIGVLAAICTNTVYFIIKIRNKKSSNKKPSDDKFFNEHIVPFLKRFEKKEK